MTPIAMVGDSWADYSLLDSGGGRKLERYGARHFIRPEPQALWLSAWDAWQADAEFISASDADGGGQWHYYRSMPPDGWRLSWRETQFLARCTSFRHLGFFPDMAVVWDWLCHAIGDVAQAKGQNCNRGDITCLNLFGYTGVGSLALAHQGAAVTHVDASKKSVAQARGNAALAMQGDLPIRWIVDDARKYVAREGRRKRRYDIILLDPPKYGLGPNGERWDLFSDLAPLLSQCRALLDMDSRALFLTVYAVRLSAVALGNLVAQIFGDLPGRIECGEITMREEARGLALPTAIFARWSNPPLYPPPRGSL